MSDTLYLSAEVREKVGKGASRVLRRAGRIPAVVYGSSQEPIAVHVEEKALIKAMSTGHFFNSIVELTVNGEALRTLPKDAAFHPVTDRPEHVDFLRVSATHAVHVRVPLVFRNELASPGIKKGGTLNIAVHELEVAAVPEMIPDDIAVDLTGLDVGATIHLSDVIVPEGVRVITHEKNMTIATIMAPPALKSTEGDTTKDDGKKKKK